MVDTPTEGADVAAAFRATTVTVSATTLPAPTIVQLSGPFEMQERRRPAAVAVYPVIGEPEVFSGSLQLTVIAACDSVAWTSMGAGGGPTGRTISVGLDAGLVPSEVVWVIVSA